MSSILSVLLLSALPAFAGSADRSYGLADATGPAAEKAATRGAKIGGKIPKKKPTSRVLVRTGAWTSVGRLNVVSEPVLNSARVAILTESNSGRVRSRASWALGELSRGRPWAEVKPMAAILEEVMAKQVDAETAYHVIEAFGKAYIPHEHSFEEDLSATKALNALAARQTEQMPAIFYVVLNRVQTFDVVVRLLRDELSEAKADPSPESLAEAYNSVLTAVRWMGSREEQLVNSFADDRSKIQSAFDALLSALDVEERRMTLLLMWSFGNIAKEPVFADLVGERVGELADAESELVRHLTAWSLYRMQTALPVRNAVRDVVVGEEIDPGVLEMLARLRTNEKEMDLIQKVWSVEPNP